MTEDAIHSLYFEALGFNNDLLQIWLTVTFAAIIAMYIAAPQITRFLRVLIAGLYLFGAFVLIGRLTYSFTQITHYRTLAVDLGLSEIPKPPMAEVIGLAYFILLIIGSIATLWFLATYKRDGTP